MQNWYTGGASWEKGVIFTWQNATATEMEKCFASTEYPTEAYRPTIVVNYAAVSTLSDGVYYLNSAAGGFLTATESSLNNSNVFQRTAKQGTGDADRMPQLWRVTHVQNGYYTIRPYHYTPAGLSANGTNAMTTSIGTSDVMEDLPSYCLWKIGDYRNSTLHYLDLFGTNWSLENYNGTTDGGNITVGDRYSGSEHDWSFEQVSSPPIAVRFYNTVSGKYESVPFRSIQQLSSATFAKMDVAIAVSAPSILIRLVLSVSGVTVELLLLNLRIQ